MAAGDMHQLQDRAHERALPNEDRVENGSGPDLPSVLRERLVFMRGDWVERLAKGGIDGGVLALLGSVGAAIAAIDGAQTRDEAAIQPQLRETVEKLGSTAPVEAELRITDQYFRRPNSGIPR